MSVDRSSRVLYHSSVLIHKTTEMVLTQSDLTSFAPARAAYTPTSPPTRVLRRRTPIPAAPLDVSVPVAHPRRPRRDRRSRQPRRCPLDLCSDVLPCRMIPRTADDGRVLPDNLSAVVFLVCLHVSRRRRRLASIPRSSRRTGDRLGSKVALGSHTCDGLVLLDPFLLAFLEHLLELGAQLASLSPPSQYQRGARREGRPT